MSTAAEPAPARSPAEPPAAAAPAAPPRATFGAFVLNLLAPGYGVARLGHERLGWIIFGVVEASLLLVRFGAWGLLTFLGLLVASWITPLVVRPAAAPPESSARYAFFTRLAIAGVWTTLLLNVYVEAFKIPSGSMMPTLQVGDHVYVDKLAYALHAPARGDLVAFVYPRDPDKKFMKRIVGVPGDEIAVKDNVVSVNGTPVERVPAGERDLEDYDDMRTSWSQRRARVFHEQIGGHHFDSADVIEDHNKDFPGPGDPAPYVVPADSYFMMGDNRNNSHDSRFWGTVPRKDVIGPVLYVWWSTGPRGRRSERFGLKVE
jgi:signal peptidase I